LVKQYPRSAEAEEAKAGIASLSAGSREEGGGSRGHGAGASDSIGATGSSAGSAVAGSAVSREKAPEGSGASSFAPMPTTGEVRGLKTAPADTVIDAGSAERHGTSAPV